jgi:hypothetical protein
MIHTAADFSKGNMTNATVMPEGLSLGPIGTAPNNWTGLGNCSPGAQWLAGFDYHPASKKFILITRDYGDFYSGVWTYELETDLWNKKADSNPPSTYGIGNGVFDTINNVMVVLSCNGSITYSFDPSTGNWTKKDPASTPKAGNGFACAYDSDTGEIVIFGGWNYLMTGGWEYYNETWSYNLSNNVWTNRTTINSPYPRAYASMVYDNANKVMVLFGGNNTPGSEWGNSSLFGDTWIYNPGTNLWLNMSPTVSPSVREKFGMAYHPVKKETILNGGITGKGFAMASDSWTFNMSRNTWTNLTPANSPPPRSGQTMAYEPESAKIVLIGGISPTVYNWRADSWNYDYINNDWTLGTLNAPSARSNHQMAYDSDTGEIVLFGGNDGAMFPEYNPFYCGDTWKYNLSQNRWTLLSPTKACQKIEPTHGYWRWCGNVMAYDPQYKEFVLCTNVYGMTMWTYSFNLSTNTWINKNATPPTDGLAMVYHKQSKQMILYDYNWGLFYLNRTANKWSAIPGSGGGPQRLDVSFQYLEPSAEMLLYVDSGQAWLFNLTQTTWTRLSCPDFPPQRRGFSMAYDIRRNEAILYGGQRTDDTFLNDTWTLNMSTFTWTEIRTPQTKPQVSNHFIVYNEKVDETLLFGGETPLYIRSPETWVFNRFQYREAGSYISQANDTGGNAYFGNISWNASIPENTGFRVQMRSAANETASNASDFYGPDGTNTSYYTTSGQQINGIHNGSRWFQYKVFMNTTSERASPIFKSLQIHYNLIHTVTIDSPGKDSNWTDSKPIKWTAIDPDKYKDALWIDIHLLDINGQSKVLAENISAVKGSYQWDTTKYRSGQYRINLTARDDNKTIPLVVNATSDWFNLSHPNRRPVVELRSPTHAQTVNSSSVELEWNATDADEDPLTCHVFLGFEEFYNDSLPDIAAITNGTSAVITNLTDKAIYYWSVIADDGKENSTMPAVSLFTVDIPIEIRNHPPELLLLTPADGANITTFSTQLSWSGSDADSDRLTYSVFVAESGFNLTALPPLFTRTNETTLDLNNLTDGSTYYWAVIAYDGKDNSTAMTVWKFTVHIQIPADTPRIVAYSPKGPKTPLNPAIVVEFDREMDTLSVVSALSISPQIDIASFNRTGNKFIFTLGSPLTTETIYDVHVSTVAKASKGKNMFLPAKWNFTTLAPGEVDSELPTVLLTDPVNGATNVDRWKNITVMFSEAMALTTTKGACSITPAVNGSWEWLNNRGFAIQFRPANGFANGTYTVTISRAATDESGNHLAENLTFSFKVGVSMTGKPKLLTKSLVGEGVRTNAQLVLAFDRQMDPASVISAFRISPAVEGNWTYDEEGKIFTFTPAKRFRAGTTYSVTISTSAKDMDGNPLAQDASWTFKTVEAASPVGIGMAEWLLLALVVVVAAGIGVFAVSRRRMAGATAAAGTAALSAPKGFAIEDIFLMYNDGRLIQHTTRRIKADMDVDIFTSMLTALQAFVKDSMGRGTGSELGSMEFGGDKILLEKGKHVIVAVVITGGEPAGFRDEMKAAVKNVESEYGPVLDGWEGDATELAGAKRFLAELGGYKLAEETPAEKPKADITLKSEVEFYQGFVRLKVAVKNNMETVVTKATFKLIYNDNMLRQDHFEPALECKGDEVILGILEPKEKKTVAFYLDPQMCTESYLEGVLTFKDARGNLETIKMPRKLTSVVCPILFTEENINTAMLKRMAADELDKNDSKVFTIPSTMTSEKAFEVGKAAIQHHDVRLVRELKEEKPFRAEAWYYGKAKGRPDRLIVQVRVIPEMSFLEFSVSSDSVLMLTGMLAELKSDLNKELETHHMKGAMKQVVDRDDMEAVAEIRHLLEKAGEAETEPAKRAGKTS